jgi:uncharacterized membrane protein YbhN (UPF0104 family)
MKQIVRWLILGGTLFFVGKAIKDHWLEVTAIRIDASGWAILAIATGITLLAHLWAGWIWTWILQELNQSVPSDQFIQVYLKTNIAKYLPGNIWHYYGRIMAVKNANFSSGAATLSVLLEPLLMAAAALIIIDVFGGAITTANTNLVWQILQFLSLIVILGTVHPWFLNRSIRLLHRWRGKKSQVLLQIKRYPLLPLLGELGFLVLRGSGFIFTMFALESVNLSQIPLLLVVFSLAWLLGFIVPGAPGGLGVFDATAIALLSPHFPTALVISAIAFYRLISIVAEVGGAALAWLDEQRCS